MYCLYACLCTKAGRGCQVSWGWSYKWLWAFLWVLGIELGSSVRAATALNHQPSHQPQQVPFCNIVIFFYSGNLTCIWNHLRWKFRIAASVDMKLNSRNNFLLPIISKFSKVILTKSVYQNQKVGCTSVCQEQLNNKKFKIPFEK